MAPRYSRFQRYRISDDVLAAILDYLDPRSLLFACKAFQRIYAIVMGYHALRYKFELAVSGMRDGAAPRAAAPLLARLHLLRNYRADWPRLHWTHEYKMQVITPSHVGTSGGFIHQIRPHGVYSTLEITELPSCRTGRSPTLTRRLRYTSPPIETVFIDPAQGLIIAGHIFCQNGIIGLQLQFRDLWTFTKHPIAPAESYEIPTQSVAPVAQATISLVGSKLAVTLEFVGGKINHLIMDWRTFGARWIDDQDICLLDEDFLLVLCKRAGSPPVLNLCNIANIANMVVLRQYELPGAWANFSIKFCPNTAARQRSPTALFCSDPANRVLVVAAKPLVKTSTSASWLFINEGYFKGVSYRRDRAVVSWSSWGQYCVVKDLPRSSRTIVRGPYAIGSRVAYLQSESGTQRSTLNLIEFSPFPDSGTRLSSSWPVVGPKATLFPSETARPLSSTTVEHYAVDDIGVTEDNIVLFLELQPGFRPVNVLTFGAPPAAARPPHR